MRVTCSSIAEWLENLRAVPHGCVYGGTVWWSINHRGLSEAVDAATVQASAVVEVVEDGQPVGQYLLEAGEECGKNYKDSTQDYGGDERAEGLRRQVEEYCKAAGLRVMPGVVSE